jgi:hypothetical protein
MINKVEKLVPKRQIISEMVDAYLKNDFKDEEYFEKDFLINVAEYIVGVSYRMLNFLIGI